MKRAEIHILQLMINNYLREFRESLEKLQLSANMLKNNQSDLHSRVRETSRSDIRTNINQYFESENNFQETEKIFDQLKLLVETRNIWKSIKLFLPQLQTANDTSVDVNTDTVPHFPIELECELLTKLIYAYEQLEAYETCAFLQKKVESLRLEIA